RHPPRRVRHRGRHRRGGHPRRRSRRNRPPVPPRQPPHRLTRKSPEENPTSPPDLEVPRGKPNLTTWPGSPRGTRMNSISARDVRAFVRTRQRRPVSLLDRYVTVFMLVMAVAVFGNPVAT